MHVKGFLHKLLSNTIHNGRLKTLSFAVEAAIHTKELSLTKLGRSINLPIQERSGIQKVNRLLGNTKLKDDYLTITKMISTRVVGNKKHPIIIIDWTKYPNSNDAVIRAAVGVAGRAVTLYEERHNEKSIGKRSIQKQFLLNLHKILPINCQPIIVTDAGFHNPWFKQVLDLGWNYIGRVRGKKSYRSTKTGKFIQCKELYRQATKEVKELGQMTLTEKNRLETNFYLIKFPSKRRKAFFTKGKWKSEKDSRDYARSHREPWLLASSLSKRNSGKKVISIYKWRMRIEEAFRDLKSARYGFGLKQVKTLRKIRRDTILLIAMLASLVVTLVGIAGEEMNLHYQFQSNSIKNRRVLSVFYLGCQLIRKKAKIPILSIWKSFALLEVTYG